MAGRVRWLLQDLDVLGANLARLEMRGMFEELLPAFATYELAAPVEWTRSNRRTGVRHLALTVTR